jgi:hypothetical protein
MTSFGNPFENIIEGSQQTIYKGCQKEDSLTILFLYDFF